MLTETHFQVRDTLFTESGEQSYLSEKDSKTWKEYIMDFQTVAQSLNPMLGKDLEKDYTFFMDKATSINGMAREFFAVTRKSKFPEVCAKLQDTPELVTLLALTCKILLSDPKSMEPDAIEGENLLYYSMLRLNDSLSAILNTYEEKRTKVQKLKNIAGGLKSKYTWLYNKLNTLYTYRIETVLKIYAATQCVPCSYGDLQYTKALFMYDKELGDRFEEAKTAYYAPRKPVSRSTLSPSPTSLGYSVPGRGSLMKLKRGYNEDYYFEPEEEGNTGGPATSENVGTYYKTKSNRRRQEEEEELSARSNVVSSTNQGGGRRHKKTRKARKSKKGTRKH